MVLVQAGLFCCVLTRLSGERRIVTPSKNNFPCGATGGGPLQRAPRAPLARGAREKNSLQFLKTVPLGKDSAVKKHVFQKNTFKIDSVLSFWINFGTLGNRFCFSIFFLTGRSVGRLMWHRRDMCPPVPRICCCVDSARRVRYAFIRATRTLAFTPHPTSSLGKFAALFARRYIAKIVALDTKSRF